MKRNFVFGAALLLLGLVIVSCDPHVKPEPEPDGPSRMELLLGKWNVDLEKSYESYVEEENNYDETRYCADWANSITIDFVSDSVLTYTSASGTWEDSWEDAYHLDNDTLTWDKWKYKVYELTDKHMVMESVIREERTLANGSILHTAEIKHYEMTRAE